MLCSCQRVSSRLQRTDGRPPCPGRTHNSSRLDRGSSEHQHIHRPALTWAPPGGQLTQGVPQPAEPSLRTHTRRGPGTQSRVWGAGAPGGQDTGSGTTSPHPSTVPQAVRQEGLSRRPPPWVPLTSCLSLGPPPLQSITSALPQLPGAPGPTAAGAKGSPGHLGASVKIQRAHGAEDFDAAHVLWEERTAVSGQAPSTHPGEPAPGSR